MIIKFVNNVNSKYKYFSYFDFIILFVDMSMLFYIINLNVVNFFAGSSFLFFTVMNQHLNLMYYNNYND
jgi:hypothetical protein